MSMSLKYVLKLKKLMKNKLLELCAIEQCDIL